MPGAVLPGAEAGFLWCAGRLELRTAEVHVGEQLDAGHRGLSRWRRPPRMLHRCSSAMIAGYSVNGPGP